MSFCLSRYLEWIDTIPLADLSSFTGQLFRRYSADLTPMIRYIVHQLQNGQTTELVVLREIIRNMTGITPLPSMTDSQIVAMAGGPYLRIEAISSATRGARLDPGDMTLKGPPRLGRALIDSQLAQPLLLNNVNDVCTSHQRRMRHRSLWQAFSTSSVFNSLSWLS